MTRRLLVVLLVSTQCGLSQGWAATRPTRVQRAAHAVAAARDALDGGDVWDLPAFWQDVHKEVPLTDAPRARALLDQLRAGEVPHPLPGQCFVLGTLFPGLTARPFHDPHASSALAWVTELERAWREVADELLPPAETKDAADWTWHGMSYGHGWKQLRLWDDGRPTSQSAHFPSTMALLERLNVPHTRVVALNRQRPGTGCKEHSDGNNMVLTCHLPLAVPTDPSLAFISVAGQRRSWQLGQALVLDTSFSHFTRNDSSEDRYVLHVDFWHPELTEAETRAVRAFWALRAKWLGKQPNHVRDGLPCMVCNDFPVGSGSGVVMLPVAASSNVVSR